MISNLQKSLRHDITPSTRKTELARNWKNCFTINWEFRKYLEFMDLNLEVKVSTVRRSEIGPSIKSLLVSHLGWELTTQHSHQGHLNSFKKISNACPYSPPPSGVSAKAFAVAKSSILMHSEGESPKELPRK